MNKNIHKIIILGASLGGSGILNYIYQYIMIQKLDIISYSEFASLLSVINLIGILTVACSLFLVKEFSKNREKIGSTIQVSQKILFIIGLLLYLIFLSVSPFIAKYLNIDDTGIVALSGLSIFFFFISIYQWAFFQGTSRIKTYAIWQIGNPFFRIIIGLILLFLGFEIYGAIGGFIGSQICLFIIGYILIRKITKNYEKDNASQIEILHSFLSQKKQILQYLFTSIVFALLMNMDILIVKNMFGGEIAGYYAAVSVVAKFLVFLGLSIETVYYPQLVKGKTLPTKQILKISVYYILMLLGALGFFYIFGEMILRLFKGGLEEYIGVVFPLLIYCGLLGYISIIVKTLIAFEKYVVNYILSVVVIAIVMCVYAFATDIYSLAYIFMLGSIVALFSTLSTLFLTSKKVK